MRYAAYIRISSEDQAGNFSVDAQQRAIEVWIEAQGEGEIVALYLDEARSGRTMERAEFQRMRRDAKQGLFDALVVHQFDRLARDRIDALAVKSLLRQDFGIRVFSVTEPSEDSHGTAGTLVEGLTESVAEWYSRNLSKETTKGKHERALQGYHNNRPPFGFDKTPEGILYPNEAELVGLRLAYDHYATGRYSDNDIACLLNEHGFVSKKGNPFSTDSVRDILQNRTYLGYVKYQQYDRQANGRRSWNTPVEWIKGKHDAVISEELFARCQRVRRSKSSQRQYHPKHHVFLLRDLIYCADCVENKPRGMTYEDYGKMRPQSARSGAELYYRCRAQDFGQKCPQSGIPIWVIEEQIIHFLKTFHFPSEWRARMINAIAEVLMNENVVERLTEIKKVIEQRDFRWADGFIADTTNYVEQRIKLQQELQNLSPLPNDEFQRATHLVENFADHWEVTQGDRHIQQKLIQLFVGRVWVRGNRIIAIMLQPDYTVTLP